MNRRNLIESAILAGLAIVVPSFGAEKLDHENYNYGIRCFIKYKERYAVYQCIYFLENGEQLNQELLAKLLGILKDKVKIYFDIPEKYGEFKYDDIDFDNIFWEIVKVKKNEKIYNINGSYPSESGCITYPEFKKKFI